jgi:hypothetical protein
MSTPYETALWAREFLLVGSLQRCAQVEHGAIILRGPRFSPYYHPALLKHLILHAEALPRRNNTRNCAAH